MAETIHQRWLAVRQEVAALSWVPDRQGRAGAAAVPYCSLALLVRQIQPIVHSHGFLLEWSISGGDLFLLRVISPTGELYRYVSVPWPQALIPVPAPARRGDPPQWQDRPAWSLGAASGTNPIQGCLGTVTYLRRLTLAMLFALVIDDPQPQADPRGGARQRLQARLAAPAPVSPQAPAPVSPQAPPPAPEEEDE